MSVAPAIRSPEASDGERREHVDVLIVGAGLSGVGAAYHLQRDCPEKSYLILEARDAIGGTWDLFRYPGIRSDSDMYTLGYSFKPWSSDKSIADGPSILGYVRETARENGIEQSIRFHHRAVRAMWSSAEQRWVVEVQRTDTGETAHVSCAFLFMCTGYYRYDQGYTPQLEGIDRFRGQVIHPQFWPEEIDYAGKRVVVIGSGATAVTLVPALADDAEHVTMLQRSPTYIVTLPSVDPVARRLRRILPERVAYGIVRWKNVLLTLLSFQLSRRRPRVMKALIRKGIERQLPAGFDLDTHFKPRYNPWDQRLCLDPDGELFKAISAGRVSIATDEIDAFTEAGIRLASGEELKADVVVTATGLNLIALGGLQVEVDGHALDLPNTMTYKGMMLADVPNLAFAVGYTNASWTLKCDLTCEFLTRMLRHMDEHGYTCCAPHNDDPSVEPAPFIDLKSGYVLRSLDRFPKQGSKAPWRLYQNYALDLMAFRRGPLEDRTLRFWRETPADAEGGRPRLAAAAA